MIEDGTSYEERVQLEKLDEYKEHEIERIYMNNDRLYIVFKDNGFVIYDGGQQCCEDRYMRSDDDVNEFEGAVFREIYLSEVDYSSDDCDHEIEFLIIKTSKGDITFSCHNEHNGFYGGFDIKVKTFDPNEPN